MQSTQTTDAVVIGAGAVGCAVALRLAQNGIIPHVTERDDIAFNASGYAWGGLSAHFGSGVPGPMTKHYRDAIDKHIQHYEQVSPERPNSIGNSNASPPYPSPTTKQQRQPSPQMSNGCGPKISMPN